ncbi:S-adenosyl-L-methionine-dependent methyltransferase [Paxillus ammoniavirescens]|nr:S-adenosyl-L-methionine-dependent methyltransferase [Paxillus ammoniavirescens]
MSLTVTEGSSERITHSYSGSLYLLPSDDAERQRLLEQHQLFTRLFSGRLIFPPISLSGKEEILDIGTGAGAWLCDVRSQLPESTQIYGVDIESRLFPSYRDISANVHLSVCSATSLPRYWSSKFALVHQRLLIFGYTRDQWMKVVDEMYRVLASGGYVQLIETGPEWDSGPKTASHVSFLEEFLGRAGLLLRCGAHIADMLENAGFVDVRSENVVMKLGKWAGQDGVEGREATIGAWRGTKDAVMKAGGMGYFATGEDFDKALDDVAEEWDSVEGSYTLMKVVYGRKP